MKPQYRFTPRDVFVTILCVFILCTCLSAVSISGRRHAKSIVCQAHLAQWGRLFQAYVAENDGTFFTGTNSMGWWWLNQLPQDQLDWKQNKIWFCPTAVKPKVDEQGKFSPEVDIHTAWGIYSSDIVESGLAGSYGLNGYMIQADSSTYGGGISTREGWKSFDVPDADRIPLFLDALRFDLWPLETEGPAINEFFAWSGNNMGRCAINRHMGAVNSLFLDGSVRRVDLKELWTLKWHKSFNTQGPWTQAGGVQPEDWPAWIRDFQAY